MPHEPLPDAEFLERRAGVMTSLEARRLDALVVTADKHKLYLGGVASTQHWPTPLIVVPGHRPVLLSRLYDTDADEADARLCDLEPYFGDDAMEVWVAVMRRLGLARGRVGFELDAPGLTQTQLGRLQAALPDVEVVDATRVIADLEMIKSPAEVAVMREIAEINRHGYAAFLAGLETGRGDLELQHAMIEALVAAGGHSPHVEVVQGARSAVPHAGYEPAADSTSASGLPAYAEFSATLFGYSAGQVRTALKGSSAEVEALFALATEVLETVEATLRPGIRSSEVDRGARAVVERAGRAATFRHRLGYSIGLLWGEAPVSVDLSPINQTVLRAGMCFHTPINLFEKGRFGIGLSETWLVTDRGCEAITVLPRELVRVP